MRAAFDSRFREAASEDAQRALARERPLDGFAAYWAANQSHVRYATEDSRTCLIT